MTRTTKWSRALLTGVSLLAITACMGTMGPSSCAASVTVAPAAATVQVGQTVQLYATVRDTGGAVLTGYSPTWISDNAAVATVGLNGLVAGVAVGQTTITAIADGQSGQATITVVAKPAAARLVDPRESLAPNPR